MENEQKYIKDIAERFNANPNDESLTTTERTFLIKIKDVEQKALELVKQAKVINDEIIAKKEQLNELNKEILCNKVESQAFVKSLLALKS